MSRFSQVVLLTCLVASASTVIATDSPAQVDASIKSYEKVSGISGSINSVGSDTLNNLMALWSESFHKLYPSVNLQVEGKGSATAPPALMEGSSQLGPMSRMMKSEETESFEKKKGYKPTAVGVALDALAVFVHKDNPIETLSLEQVDAIFSKTRKRGQSADIDTWGKLDAKHPEASHPISIYGRNSASGTYGFFKEHALKKGDFKDSVKEQPGSSSVVMSITSDKDGIGYSGVGYKTSGVKMVKLSEKTGEPGVDGTPENVINKSYPMGRMLYIYIDKKPGEALPPAVEQFLRFVLSKEGQEIVLKDGYFALPGTLADKERGKLN